MIKLRNEILEMHQLVGAKSIGSKRKAVDLVSYKVEWSK